jgi:hypothetical protein
MSASQELIAAYVDRAVEEFSYNPLSAEFLRRLSDELPQEFCAAAMRHLKEPGESDAYRLMSTLLVRHPLVFDQISNPNSGRDATVGVARRLLALDRSFDLRLARKLPDREGKNHREAFSGSRAFRILDVLGDVTSGTRLVPILRHLVESSDTKMSSKAALFVGRRLQSAAWAGKLLKHNDQRIRANAVESLWGMLDAASVTLLHNCLYDENNRVKGNAGFGLHLADAPGVVEAILKMARDSRPAFRSTAAWVLGRMGDPGFAADLKRLVKDESSAVRSTALRALIQLRRREEAATLAKAVQLPNEESTDLARLATALERPPEPTPEPEPVVVAAPIELRLDGSTFRLRNGKK